MAITKQITHAGSFAEDGEIPPQAYLLECYDYNPETGFLIYKERPPNHFQEEIGYLVWMGQNKNKIGLPVDTKGTKHYGQITLRYNGKKYRIQYHAVIWKMLYDVEIGRHTKIFVDHINRNGKDNRLINLRLCTWSENNVNRKFGSNKGCSFHNGKWEVRGAKKYLGRFSSLTEAKDVYLVYMNQNFGEFATA